MLQFNMFLALHSLPLFSCSVVTHDLFVIRQWLIAEDIWAPCQESPVVVCWLEVINGILPLEYLISPQQCCQIQTVNLSSDSAKPKFLWSVSERFDRFCPWRTCTSVHPSSTGQQSNQFQTCSVIQILVWPAIIQNWCRVLHNNTSLNQTSQFVGKSVPPLVIFTHRTHRMHITKIFQSWQSWFILRNVTTMGIRPCCTNLNQVGHQAFCLLIPQQVWQTVWHFCLKLKGKDKGSVETQRTKN